MADGFDENTSNNWATTEAAITAGSLPVMPGNPIGQVTCCSSSGAKPRSASRRPKVAHLVWLPISPTQRKSPWLR